MSSIEERVAAGARWLDEHRPGWVDRIDLETLDLGDPCRCVLGQEYGNYTFALDEILDDVSPASRGFNAWATTGEYPALTDAWRRLIEQRRAVAWE